ncbi:putative protein DNA repair protein RAD25 [Pyrococcus sp. NA2]|uniref:DEAD/DEAH box helicase n=1 Tax=Pyrococcus sp. (strain NA2) TaxID=342949 RepID=UPI000209AEAE|nr:DEAD/DEAH box helicase [Pyrococcus sp. NA2]AEC52316.1 putative protein DNA repair protein RAD25 [Pyrococcus sp. NA2]
MSATIIEEFNAMLKEKLDFSLRPYQEYVINDIINSTTRGDRFIVVSMPTGSGKTLIEIFMAYYSLKLLNSRVLVLEPTRFLCDQMYSKLWNRVFGDLVGKEYEGNCHSFLDPNKKVIISTPQTALKCVSTIREKFNVVIIDEIHHAFGGKYYTELLINLDPSYVFGFTALLPSKKRRLLDFRVELLLGVPKMLTYDFKRLSEISTSFQPPRAIADLFDADMNELEERVYEKLFLGMVDGDSRTVKFLENTLANYGKMAFCESLGKAIAKNKVLYELDFERLCNSSEPSHKARVLCEVLTVYDVKDNDELKPVIVFTSRKATAYEFKDVIVKLLGFSQDRVEVLTSDMSKDERLDLIKRVKEGLVDIIISTLVGEEGVDIPEAGLLVMTDIPKSPLRFYQRLGRLIRVASPRRIKYLVISMTPKTREYYSLEEALWNLYSEGVDVSYIIYNLGEKGPESKVLDVLDKFSSIYNDVAVPFTLMTQGRELSDPINYLTKLAKSDREFLKILEDRGFRVESDEMLSAVLSLIITNPFRRWLDDVKDALNRIEKLINKGSFTKVLDKSMRENRVFYVYDIEMMSDLISEELKGLYYYCISEKKGFCENVFFRIDRKSILRLFMRVFPFKHIDNILERIRNKVFMFEENFRSLKESKRLLIYVDLSRYNERNMSLSPKVVISLDVGVGIRLEAQINYYNVTRNDESTYQKILELVKLNLLAIGYRGVEKFLEFYESTN